MISTLTFDDWFNSTGYPESIRPAMQVCWNASASRFSEMHDSMVEQIRSLQKELHMYRLPTDHPELDGLWVVHNGAGCPLPVGTRVTTIRRNGRSDSYAVDEASVESGSSWCHDGFVPSVDVVVYRVDYRP